MGMTLDSTERARKNQKIPKGTTLARSGSEDLLYRSRAERATAARNQKESMTGR